MPRPWRPADRRRFPPLAAVRLDDRVVPATVTFTDASGLLVFAGDAAAANNAIVNAPVANSITIEIDKATTFTLAGDATNPAKGFSLSDANGGTKNLLTIDLTKGVVKTFNFNVGGAAVDPTVFQLLNPTTVETVTIADGAGTNALAVGGTAIPGAFTATAERISVVGLLDTSAGAGGVSLTASGIVNSTGVGLNVTAEVRTGLGGITLVGRGGDALDTNIGVRVSGTVGSTGGPVSVTGVGGSPATTDNFGVAVVAGGVVRGKSVSVSGVAGGGNGSAGVFVSDVGSVVESTNGTLSVTGSVPAAGPFAVQLANSGKLVATGALAVNADTLSIDATAAVLATGNTATLVPATAGVPIDLGGADVLTATPVLGLTSAELSRVSAATLVVGSPAAGPVSVTSIVASPTNVLDVQSATTITAAASLIAPAVRFGTVNGSVSLTGPLVNVVSAAIGGAASTFELKNNGVPLTVGSVAGTDGVSAAGGVTIAADGANGLTISKAVTAAAGPVSLSGGAATINADVSGTKITVAATAGPADVNAKLTASTGDVSVTASGVITTTAAISAAAAASLTGKSVSIGAAVSGASVAIGATNGTLAVNGLVSATGGAATLTATGALTTAAAVSATAAASLSGGAVTTGAAVSGASASLTATAGNLDVNGTVTATAGPANLSATGAITVSAAVSGTDVSANGASISLAAGVSAAGTVGLTAAGAVTQTAAGVVTANLVTISAGSADLATAANPVANVSGTAAGDFKFQASAALAVTGPVLGANVAIAAGGSLSINAAVSSGTTITLTGGAISQTAAGVLTANLVTITSGSTDLTAATNAVPSVSGTASAGAFRFRAAGSLAVSGPVTATTDVELRADAAGGLLAVNQPVTADNGVLLIADDVAIAAQVWAKAAAVRVRPATAARPIALGANPAGSLGLDGVELGFVKAAGGLAVGGPGVSGPVTIAAAVGVQPGFTFLAIETTGVVSQAAAVAVNTLSVVAGNVLLDGFANAVSAVSGSAATGAFRFASAAALTAGPVTAAFDMGFGVPGLLTIAGPVSSTGGPVVITAADVAINQPVSAAADAIVLRPIAFGTPVNLGTDAAGEFSLTDAEFARLTAGVRVDIGLGGSASAITNSAPVTSTGGFPLLRLDATGPVTQAPAAGLTVASLQVVTTAAGGVALDAANAVGTLAGTSAGGFSLQNTAPLTVNGVTAAGPVSLTAATGLLTIAAPVAGTAVTLVADNQAIDATVSAGAGPGLLRPANAGVVVRLGGADAAGQLGLTDAELGRVTAGTLTIGDAASTAGVRAVAAITPHPGYATLSLIAAGPIDQAAAGPIAVNALSLAGTAIDLTAAANPVAQLTAAASAGPVRFRAAGDAAVGPVTATADVDLFTLASFAVANSVTAGGAVRIVADDLTIAAAVSAGSTISIRPTTAGRAIDLGTNTPGALGLTAVELALLTAPGGVDLGDATTGNILISQPVAAVGFARLGLTTAGGVTQATGATLAVPTLGVSAASVALAEPGNAIATVSGTATAGGFALASASPLTANGITAAGNVALTLAPGQLLTLAAPTTAGGDATLIADDMAVNATVTAPGRIRVSPATAGQPINLGTDAPGALGLTAAELAQLSAGGAVEVGDAVRTGAIVSSQPVAVAAGVPLLVLTANGPVTQPGGAITAPTLVVSAGGPVTLNGGNAVATLTGTAGGGFAFTATGPLTLTDLTAGGDIAVSAAGALTVAPAAVVRSTAPAGTINLNYRGTLTLRGTSLIAGGGATFVGGAGPDVARISASPATVFTVVGGNDGDTLELDAEGAGVTDTGTALIVSGRQAVNYSGLAGFTLTAAGDLTIAGTAAADTLDVRRDGAVVRYALNGGPAVGYGGSRLVFDAGGGDDTLRLRYADGVPLPANGLGYLPGVGTDTLAVEGTAAADVLSLNAGPEYVLNGLAPVAVPAERFTFAGLAGDDRLLIDATIPLPGGVAFDGGGDTNAVSLTATPAIEVGYAPSAAGAGTLTAGPLGVGFTGAAAVDVRTAAGVRLTTPNADDALAVAQAALFTDPATAAVRVSGTSGGVAVVPLAVTGVGTLVVDTSPGGGTDSISVAAIAPAAGVSNVSLLSLAGSTTTLTAPLDLPGELLVQAANVSLAGVRTGGRQTYTAAAIAVPADATLAAGGDVRFGGTLAGPGGLAVTAPNVAFAAAVGVSPLASLTVNGPATLAGGVAKTAGAQAWNGSLTAADDTTFAAGGDLTFAGPLTATGKAVAANAGGVTTFGGAVSVGSLATDAAGRTAVNGGSVTAAGAIAFADAVTVGADTTFTAGSDVTFAALDGGKAVSVAAPGTTTFNGAVSVGSLATDAAGSTRIGGGSVRTTGGQTFADDVTLAADAALAAGGAVAFGRTVAGDSRLTVNTPADTTFGGAVSVRSLTTDAGGRTTVSSQVTTAEGQSFGDAVSVPGDTTFAAGGAVAFSAELSGAGRVAVNSPADVTLGGPVAVGGLVTDAGGRTIVRAATVAAAAELRFADDVRLEADARLTTDGAATFAGRLDADVVRPLAVRGGGAVTFGGPVSGLGRVTVESATELAVVAPFVAVGLVQAAGSGATTIDGALTLGADGLDLTSAAVRLNADVRTPGVVRLAPATGGAAQSAGVLETSSLVLAGAGTFALDRDGNVIPLFRADVAGGVSLATTGDMKLDADNGGLATAGGDATLRFGGNFRAGPDSFDAAPSPTAPAVRLGAGALDVRPGPGGARVVFTVEAEAAAVRLGTPGGANTGPDVFVVRPSRTTPITVTGNDPAFPLPDGAAGDELTVRFDGAIVRRFTSTGAAGSYTYADRKLLTFTGIEVFTRRAIAGFVVQTAEPNDASGATGPAYAVRVIRTQDGVDLGGGVDGAGLAGNPFVVSPNRVSPEPPAPPRLAFADVNGDGAIDLIIGNGPGSAPLLTVIDGTALDADDENRLVRLDRLPPSAILAQFFAYEPTFLGGVNVAAGDFDGDGKAEVVTAADSGGGPRIRVFDAVSGAVRRDFFAYEPSFRGGARVAVGDTNDDGTPDLVIGTGVGGGPRVLVYSGKDLAILRSFFAYDPSFRGGIFVDAGRYAVGGSAADIVTAPGAGGGPHVRVWAGGPNEPIAVGRELGGFLAFDLAAGSDPLLGRFEDVSSGVGGVAFGAGSKAGSRDILVATPRGAAAQILAFTGNGATPTAAEDLLTRRRFTTAGEGNAPIQPPPAQLVYGGTVAGFVEDDTGGG